MLLKTVLWSIALGVTLPSSAIAAPIIKCESAGAGSFTINMDAKTKFGASLNCISGPIPTEGEACAPSNGFGLAAPTGSGSIVEVVFRWQDYGSHVGPVYGTSVSPASIEFTGGYKSHEGQKWLDQWKLEIDRITGSAKYLTRHDNTAVYRLAGTYSCTKKEQMF